MNTPYINLSNAPELGTLEDLLVALRAMDPDADEVFSTTLIMEDYHTVITDMAVLKGTGEALVH